MQYIIIGLVSLILYSPALADTLEGKVVKVKVELIHGKTYNTCQEAKTAIF